MHQTYQVVLLSLEVIILKHEAVHALSLEQAAHAYYSFDC